MLDGFSQATKDALAIRGPRRVSLLLKSGLDCAACGQKQREPHVRRRAAQSAGTSERPEAAVHGVLCGRATLKICVTLFALANSTRAAATSSPSSTRVSMCRLRAKSRCLFEPLTFVGRKQL